MRKITAEQAASAPVAQRTEQGASTSEAEGSNPSRRTSTKKTGRPAKAPEDKLIPVPVRLTPAQRDKLQRIGAQKLRDWLDRVKE